MSWYFESSGKIDEIVLALNKDDSVPTHVKNNLRQVLHSLNPEREMGAYTAGHISPYMNNEGGEGEVEIRVWTVEEAKPEVSVPVTEEPAEESEVPQDEVG